MATPQEIVDKATSSFTGPIGMSVNPTQSTQLPPSSNPAPTSSYVPSSSPAIAPASEVGMVSSENAIADVQAAQEKEKALTGTIADANKTETAQDPAPNSIADYTKFFEDNNMALPGDLSPEVVAAQNEIDSLNKHLDTFIISDKQLRTDIKEITAGYKSRITDMKEINRRREKTFETLGFRVGGQFSGGIKGGVFGGIISEEERAGVMRITALEAAMKKDIREAKKAASDNNYSVYVQKINNAQKIKEDQLATVEKLNKLYIDFTDKVEAEKKAADELNRQVTLDSSIASLVQQGINDPTEIIDLLNFSEDGTMHGDVTLKDVAASLEMIQKVDPYKGASASIKDFRILFPKADLGTTEGYQQYLRFKSQVAASTRAPKAGTGSTTTTPVSSNDGGVLSYEEWKATPAAQTALGQEQNSASQSFTSTKADSILRPMYDELILQHYRDNPSKQKNLSAANIPPPLKELLISDIEAKTSLNDLYNAYPEISTSYISSLYSSLNKKEKATDDTADVDLQAFLNSED